MKLQALLDSLCQDTACHDLRTLLKNAKGEASWFGKKIIVHKEHEGYIDCATFVTRYLEPSLKNAAFKKDLRNRVEGLELIDQLSVIIKQADTALKTTLVVKHIFSDAQNLDERLYFLSKELREFTKQSFLTLFPHIDTEEKQEVETGFGKVENYFISRKDLNEVTSLV